MVETIGKDRKRTYYHSTKINGKLHSNTMVIRKVSNIRYFENAIENYIMSDIFFVRNKDSDIDMLKIKLILTRILCHFSSIAISTSSK